MSKLSKYSCVNNEKQCNFIKPFGTDELIGRINPATGRNFEARDVEIIDKHFQNTCSSKDGTQERCCDAFDNENTQISKELLAKYPNIKVNRRDNKIESIDVCYRKNVKDCPGDGWEASKPYHICKLDNSSPSESLSKNSDRFTELVKDCYSVNCNPQDPEISLSNFIGDSSGNRDYTYFDDIKVADAIRLDSVNALVNDYNSVIEQNINRVLTHNDRGDTMLHEAMRNGAKKVVAFLVGRGADLNSKNVQGETPLHIGAQLNKVNLCYALLNYGANINEEDNRGELPIFNAVKDGSIDMLRLLFSNGGNIYHINKDGNNLAHMAIYYSTNDKKEKVKFLVEHGVSIDTPNNDGLTVLQLSQKMNEEYHAQQNKNKILEGFECLTGFKQYEKTLSHDLPEIVTYLEKIYYKQNKDKFSDFITGELPNSSYVEYIYGECLGADGDTKKECQKNGGEWRKYDKVTTKVKIEYPDPNENALYKMNNEDLYVEKCSTPKPIKILPHMKDKSILEKTTKPKINNKKNNKPNNNKTIEGFENNNPKVVNSKTLILGGIFALGVIGLYYLTKNNKNE